MPQSADDIAGLDLPQSADGIAGLDLPPSADGIAGLELPQSADGIAGLDLPPSADGYCRPRFVPVSRRYCRSRFFPSTHGAIGIAGLAPPLFLSSGRHRNRNTPNFGDFYSIFLTAGVSSSATCGHYVHHK